MTTKTDEQERAAFEAWANGRCELHLVNPAGRYSSAITQFAWEAYQAGRAALQAQPQETIAYVTRNEEGDPAMLFFDLQEARLYCEPDEAPEALVLAGPALQSQDREDAERYRWVKRHAHPNRGFDEWCLPYVDYVDDNLDTAIDHARRIEGKGNEQFSDSLNKCICDRPEQN